MRKLLLLLLAVMAGFSLFGVEKVFLEYFYSNDCMDCRSVTELFLPALQEETGNRYEIKFCELSDETNFLQLLEYLNQSHDDSNEKMYMVVNRKIIIGGRTAIEATLFDIIQREYTAPDSRKEIGLTASANLKEKFKLPMVLSAGLLDGINPCVFATLIFFLSLLAASPVGRAQMIKIGIVYILAGFLTYFVIGVGLFKILHLASSTPYLRNTVNSAMILGLLVLAGISFADVFRFRSGGARAVILQLPSRFKKQIHQLMRNQRRQAFLLSGTFILSVAVTLLESVCTGQVYVPTLLLLANETDGVNRWWWYLLLYNLMFTVPLIVIFILAVWSVKVNLLIKLSRHDVKIAKILTGLFFLLLATLLAYFEFFR